MIRSLQVGQVYLCTEWSVRLFEVGDIGGGADLISFVTRCSPCRWPHEERFPLGRGCHFLIVLSTMLSVGLTILLNLGLFALGG